MLFAVCAVMNFSSWVKAAFGRRRWSPGRSGPRSAAGGRPGGGADEGPVAENGIPQPPGPCNLIKSNCCRVRAGLLHDRSWSRSIATGQGPDGPCGITLRVSLDRWRSPVRIGHYEGRPSESSSGFSDGVISARYACSAVTSVVHAAARSA